MLQVRAHPPRPAAHLHRAPSCNEAPSTARLGFGTCKEARAVTKRLGNRTALLLELLPSPRPVIVPTVVTDPPCCFSHPLWLHFIAKMSERLSRTGRLTQAPSHLQPSLDGPPQGNSASDRHSQKALSSQGRIKLRPPKPPNSRETELMGFAVYSGAVAHTHVTPFLYYSKVTVVAGS